MPIYEIPNIHFLYLAWEKHGFRTSGYEIISEGGAGRVDGVADSVTRVMEVPDYPAMRLIIEGL